MRPPVFVRLNAFDNFGGGAFTFTINSSKKNHLFFDKLLTFFIKYTIIRISATSCAIIFKLKRKVQNDEK